MLNTADPTTSSVTSSSLMSPEILLSPTTVKEILAQEAVGEEDDGSAGDVGERPGEDQHEEEHQTSSIVVESQTKIPEEDEEVKDPGKKKLQSSFGMNAFSPVYV